LFLKDLVPILTGEATVVAPVPVKIGCSENLKSKKPGEVVS
jgi:hypothetical protein